MNFGDKYKSLVDNIIHGIRESDIDGTITYANKQMESLCRFTVDEMVGKLKVWDLGTPENIERHKQEYFRTAKEYLPIKPFLTQHILKDGSIIDVQIDWNYKKDKDGNIIGFVSMLTDITKYTKEHIYLEKKIKERTIELQRANEILKLTSDVSRNILSVDSFDISECLRLIVESLKLTELFICYRNGKVKYSRISKTNNNTFEIIRQCNEISNCAWCLKDQKYVFEGKAADFPEKSCIFKTKEKVDPNLNFLVLPILIYDELWGMIGFGQLTKESWSPIELDALSNLGRLIAIIVNNEEIELSLANHIKNKFGQVQQLMKE